VLVLDVTSTALHAALRGLSARRDVLASNVANVETPGYRAQRVDFESALAAALDAARDGDVGALGRATPSVTTTSTPARANGNNVSLDDEVVAQEQNELHHATVVEALNSKLRLLRTAIDGGR
jgi:flagellar basal-body rod protein FlgB